MEEMDMEGRHRHSSFLLMLQSREETTSFPEEHHLHSDRLRF